MKNSNLGKVENFEGVKNQFIITTDKGRFFQSYDSIIAFKPNEGKVLIDEVYWTYSKTTSKYLYRFLNTTKKEIKMNLLMGDYLHANLN